MAIDAHTATIRRLLAAFPALFYRQSWYENELFIDETLPATTHGQPPHLARSLPYLPHTPAAELVPAVELVWLYVRYPGAQIWNGYLWTASTDHAGQRVYVGGMQNGNGFEIHRHLHLTERWGIPTWE
jgi:hypothetical protein